MTSRPDCDCGHKYLSHKYQSNTGCFGPCDAGKADEKCDCPGYRRVLS